MLMRNLRAKARQPAILSSLTPSQTTVGSGKYIYHRQHFLSSEPTTSISNGKSAVLCTCNTGLLLLSTHLKHPHHG
ncbi:hypothetical protein BO85DRAFT_77594 [Aspergillus piperis CBS 112811]|uniref:Uncharacterized protein n=1 Tax=Aspergillus piperis CBS 112811 TaxID=1448313 RepID=A0A8G1QZS9_9EURO|nr:hypothetical protein BO85DRAFT_77594 [Aspergillus piperis CBS 112811]RAH55619.1 hypothetical protein BO85DRAFT_77594 [Aspergillus piperis CBS 112811]